MSVVLAWFGESIRIGPSGEVRIATSVLWDGDEASARELVASGGAPSGAVVMVCPESESDPTSRARRDLAMERMVWP